MRASCLIVTYIHYYFFLMLYLIFTKGNHIIITVFFFLNMLIRWSAIAKKLAHRSANDIRDQWRAIAFFFGTLARLCHCFVTTACRNKISFALKREGGPKPSKMQKMNWDIAISSEQINLELTITPPAHHFKDQPHSCLSLEL